MGSQSKEKILSKIREALSRQEPLKNKPDFSSEIFAPLDEDIVVAFAENYVKTGGEFIYCNSKEDFFDKFYELKRKLNLNNAFCYGDELSKQITNAGIEIITDSTQLIEKAEAGITLCESLIARTGSILLSSGLGGGRSLSIYPPTQIVVAYTSQIVKDIEVALLKIKNNYLVMPSMISLVSGPSRTADIEKTLVMGAHGPKQLFLFLIDDSKY